MYISVPRSHQLEKEEGMPRFWFHFASFLTRKCSSFIPGSDLKAAPYIHFNDMKKEYLIWRFSYCLRMIWVTDEQTNKQSNKTNKQNKQLVTKGGMESFYFISFTSFEHRLMPLLVLSGQLILLKCGFEFTYGGEGIKCMSLRLGRITGYSKRGCFFISIPLPIS